MIKKFDEFINESFASDENAKRFFIKHYDDIMSDVDYEIVDRVDTYAVDGNATVSYNGWEFGWASTGTIIGGEDYDWEDDFDNIDYKSPNNDTGSFSINTNDFKTN